ncbi:MAG: hypothetical protein KatS3mg026_1110 [Bacteroidia bacterium]|nr:MAG: hypothetical protein KatS3mg026_1110 [Bacteroidia bacterium]
MWLYVDPGLGALVLQAIIAGAAAAWLLFRKSIARLFFWRKHKDTSPQKET